MSYHGLMPYSFECGVCHATYRLDKAQITAGGVKITCPKCLNYFFLRKAVQPIAAETPVIEHIVNDGPSSIEVPPPLPNEPTADQLISDRDLEPSQEISIGAAKLHPAYEV